MKLELLRNRQSLRKVIEISMTSRKALVWTLTCIFVDGCGCSRLLPCEKALDEICHCVGNYVITLVRYVPCCVL